MFKILNGAAVAALLLLSPLAVATPAWAHAELVAAAPAADSTVAAPLPTELRLSFSEPVELAFSKVSVTGPDGTDIELNPLQLDPADAKTLVVPLKAALPAGVVKIEWTAVAADSHKSKGSYTLTIVP